MYKYRNPNGDGEIRVVTETGHIALVGPEPKALPEVYHNAAIAAGCACDAPTLAKNKVELKASPDAVNDKTAEQKIEAALKTMLERDVEGDFTSNGEPNLNAVAKLAGMKVSRAAVSPIFARLKAEAEADDNAGDGGGDGAGDDGGSSD